MAVFQEIWQEAYNLQQEIGTTVGTYGYGNKATENTARDDETYAGIVANFVTAFAANLAAFSNLTKPNTTLQSNMMNTMEKMQHQLNSITTQMTKLAHTPNPPPPPS